MLQIFFLITFIAEIIVGYQIVTALIRWDNSLKELNTKVLEFQPELKKILADTKTSVNKAMVSFGSIVTFIGEKRSQCKNLFSKNFLSVIGCAVLKIPFKQMVSVLDFLLTFKKLLKV